MTRIDEGKNVKAASYVNNCHSEMNSAIHHLAVVASHNGCKHHEQKLNLQRLLIALHNTNSMHRLTEADRIFAKKIAKEKTSRYKRRSRSKVDVKLDILITKINKIILDQKYELLDKLVVICLSDHLYTLSTNEKAIFWDFHTQHYSEESIILVTHILTSLHARKFISGTDQYTVDLAKAIERIPTDFKIIKGLHRVEAQAPTPRAQQNVEIDDGERYRRALVEDNEYRVKLSEDMLDDLTAYRGLLRYYDMSKNAEKLARQLISILHEDDNLLSRKKHVAIVILHKLNHPSIPLEDELVCLIKKKNTFSLAEFAFLTFLCEFGYPELIKEIIGIMLNIATKNGEMDRRKISAFEMLERYNLPSLKLLASYNEFSLLSSPSNSS